MSRTSSARLASAVAVSLAALASSATQSFAATETTVLDFPAGRALEAIRNAVRSLELSPFSYRKATSGNPFLRELVIPFGASAYVELFEIDDDKTVSILAVRHQREDDYH